MKRLIQIFAVTISLLMGTVSEAQVFKHLRRGAPGISSVGYYNTNYMASATDTVGNLYLLMTDSFNFGLNYNDSLLWTVCHIEVWNGTLWIKTSPITIFSVSHFRNDVVEPPVCTKMVVYDGSVIVAGNFDSSSTNLGGGLVAWDGVKWSRVGNGLYMSSRWRQNSYQRWYQMKDVFQYGSKLVITGNFDSIPGDIVNGGAQLNSSGNWEPLGNVKGNTPFHLYGHDSLTYYQVIPPVIDVVLDSMYMYQLWYYIPFSGGHDGMFNYISNKRQSEQWVFNGQMGVTMYASDGKSYRPVPLPRNFVVCRAFEYKKQLTLLGHSDSGIYINQLARRDSAGIWHVLDLPDHDSFMSFSYYDKVRDNYQEKGHLFFTGKLYTDLSKYSAILKFYEYDGNTITGHGRVYEDSVQLANVYYVHESGKKRYLTGSFIDLKDYSSRKVDAGFNCAAEILNTRTITFRGKAFIDWNLDEVWQSYEPVLRNKIIYIRDSGYSASTDNDGNYVLYVPAGGNRDLRINTNQYYVPAWSASKMYNSTRDTVITSNFPFDVKLDRDLQVELIPYTGEKAKRGTVSRYALRVSNISGKPVKGIDVKVQLNKGITLFNSAGTAAGYDTAKRVASWRYAGTLQGDSAFYLFYTCKYSADSFSYGDTVHTIAWIINSYSDADTSNNKLVLNQHITSAYDPNSKECDPSGKLVSKPDHIVYTIHFQNEGNDTASRVVVVDTLDPIMPMYEVEIGAASHPFHFSVENNIMVWEFDRIGLPHKYEDELGSCGFLSFTVKLNKPIKVGDSVRNRAGIYFDYEKPVLTNYASIVVVKDNGDNVQDNQSVFHDFTVFPNPAKGSVTIRNLGAKSDRISIYTIDGQLICERIFNPNEERVIDVSGWAQGVYIIRASSGETARLLKMQ